jgi:DNA (cytosine-5)-methyltransferase 1
MGKNNGMDDIKCNDEGLRELALFAGAGGGILGGLLLGWRTVCAVEYNAYARSVLLARQNDGTLTPFPVWDDVRTFGGKPWRGRIDVVSGGFPCQDISVAGKGAGITGERSGLWKEMARIIGEVRPRYAFIENSPILTKRGLDTVLCDLAKMRFNVAWIIVGPGNFGAAHRRERIWILADAKRDEQPREKSCIRKIGRMGWKHESMATHRNWESALCEFRGMDDVMARSVDRTDCIRNGQVPFVAATAFNLLRESLE